MEDQKSVYLVDDNEEIRKSLQYLFQSVGLKTKCFATGEAFLEGFDHDGPTCVILDIRLRGINGVDLLENLRKDGCQVPILILTGHGDVPHTVRAMKAGAINVLEKPVRDQVLLDHIHKALSIDTENHEKMAETDEVHARISSLTKRENEVMGHVVAGLSSREIAEVLDVSAKTIETHRAKIMKKMRARSVPHLIHLVLLAEGTT